MSGIKKAGGIISLVSAIFIFIMVFIRASSVFGSIPLLDKLSWFIFLATAILLAIGGILGILNKRLGGILALIGITIAIVISLLLYEGEIICDYSLVVYIYHSIGIYSILCGIVSVDSILGIVGGILIVAGGSD